MKTLLQKSLRPFIIYALLVLTASVPVYYLLIDNIWQKELDEHNRIVADRTAFRLNQLEPGSLDSSIALWNRMQPETSIQKTGPGELIQDSLYTITRINPYSAAHTKDRFRGLRKSIKVREQAYVLTIETNIEETEETVLVIALATLLFFIVLVSGFIILNRKLSLKLWAPFRNTLQKLKSFRLHQHQAVHFEQSDIREFEELNEALQKLIANNIAAYAIQKEFTENAAHELQTPLAIIKNKLDLLLQKESLTGRQYQIIEDINKSLSRISRINKNLLLLAKIENQQFDAGQAIDISQLAGQSIESLEEHIMHKNLATHFDMEAGVSVHGNSTLVELLLHNLLLNAIRHTGNGGQLSIQLSSAQLDIANSGTASLDTQKLFRRFSKMSTDSTGTGLGLAIVQQVCLLHRWELTYRFEEGAHHFIVQFARS